MRVEASNRTDRAAGSDLAGRDDGSLVSAARNGDHAAFELLIHRHERMILLRALRVTCNRDDAEDVVQQTFHNAFVHLKRFEGRSSFSTWLTRIAINEALMLRRNRWRSRVVSIDELNAKEDGAAPMQVPDSQPGPEHIYCRRERSRLLHLAMSELTPDMRAALQIRHIDERSTKEAARIMGVSVPAVKSRVNRGRRLLRKKLERHISFKTTLATRDLMPAA